MRIGELAHRTGVSRRLLRYYEEQGLLHPVRLPNGYREYGPGAVERVRNIRLLLESGLTSEDVQELQDCLEIDLVREPACAEAVALYEHRLRAVRNRIEALTATERRIERQLSDGP